MNQLDLNFDICEVRHGGNKESTEAHDSIIRFKTHLHEKIFNTIMLHGGMTCDELEFELGYSHQTTSARISELKLEGRLKKEGTRPTRTGRHAAVLVCVK